MSDDGVACLFVLAGMIISGFITSAAMKRKAINDYNEIKRLHDWQRYERGYVDLWVLDWLEAYHQREKERQNTERQMEIAQDSTKYHMGYLKKEPPE